MKCPGGRKQVRGINLETKHFQRLGLHLLRDGLALFRAKGSLGLDLSTGFEEVTGIRLKQGTGLCHSFSLYAAMQ